MRHCASAPLPPMPQCPNVPMRQCANARMPQCPHAGRSRSDSASAADSDDTSTMSCSMPEGWRRYTTPDGRPYFFNPAGGGRTQWEPPVLRYVTDDGRAYFYDPKP